LTVQEYAKQLCDQPGPSGFETAATLKAGELLAPLVDEVRIDRLGNLIGLRRCGKENARKIVLDAHMDEIGFIVTGVEDGFLRFTTLGGVDPRMLPNRELTILTDPPIFGVCVCLPPHVQSDADFDNSTPIDELFIDIGMSQEKAKELVPIGTPIVYNTEGFELMNGRFCAKALDDRACFATLLRAAELLKDKPLQADVYIVGSICEEVGSYRGATTAVYDINPDVAIAVDVTHAKTPDSSSEVRFKPGSGAAIAVGTVATRWVSNKLVSLAKEREIPYNIEVASGPQGTNAFALQISKEGIACCLVSLPIKYMHTPVEVMDSQDGEAVANLLAAFVETLGEEDFPCCKL
jgi:Cellulase M and related proteins